MRGNELRNTGHSKRIVIHALPSTKKLRYKQRTIIVLGNKKTQKCKVKIKMKENTPKKRLILSKEEKMWEPSNLRIENRDPSNPRKDKRNVCNYHDTIAFNFNYR